jgi:beta-glucosidase
VKTIQERPPYLNPAHPIPERVNDLLGRMTLDEKFAQLVSFWFFEMLDGQQLSNEKVRSLLVNGVGQISRVGGSSTRAPVDAAHASNVIQQFLINQTRLGIPAILHEECCAGYMGLGGSAFPQMIGVASTWNTSLVEQMTHQIRRQMLAVGARQGLGPVLDIASDPRWGRIEETFGEDPLLVSQFGVAYIRGLQGKNGEVDLLATGKHFVGHSLSLGGLNCAPAQVGPRMLREIYLMPYQAAIKEAGLKSIMNAYPELDGELVAASRSILTDLLRDKLGFEGIVVSDYNAIQMITSYHHVAPDERSAAVKAFKAGIDMELPTRDCYGEPLCAALEAGEISMEEIDAAVGRILQVKFEIGLFENPYVDESVVPKIFETAEQRDLAREVARQSMVLLKNDGLLPLGKPRSIAVIGPNADTPRNLLGDYSYQAVLELMILAPTPGSAFVSEVDEDYVRANSVRIPSILDGIRACVEKDTQVFYAPGCSVTGQDRSGFDEAISTAGQADVVILVLGDKAGLVPDCTVGETRDRAELGLPGVQEELVKAVVAVGKPVVAVLINGRPLSIPWMQENVPAILEAWLPGEEGASAVAEVLFGAYSPGGKLPVTVARSVGQVPITYNHKPSGGHSLWYDNYVELPASPLYPFGHGLSYTTFAYSDLHISPEEAVPGKEVEINLTITNEGKVRGDEVVQLYVRDKYASISRPVKELKGFCRVALDPGESRRLTFQLPVDILAFYDENLELVVEAGQIKVMLGSSSEDVRLQGEFEVAGTGKMQVRERVFFSPVTIQ